MRTLVRHQHDTLSAPIWRLCSTVPGRKAAQITPVPNANRPHSLCWSRKHKEWGRWVRFGEKSDTAASWGQNHSFLRPRRQRHLRPLAALPPLAVLGSEVPMSPWYQSTPAHRSLRSREFIASIELPNAPCPYVVKLPRLNAAAVHVSHAAKPHAKGRKPQPHPITAVVHTDMVVAVECLAHTLEVRQFANGLKASRVGAACVAAPLDVGVL